MSSKYKILFGVPVVVALLLAAKVAQASESLYEGGQLKLISMQSGFIGQSQYEKPSERKSLNDFMNGF